MIGLQDKAMKEWKNDVAFFEANKEKIKQEYGEDTYVVVKNQKIIDSGPNEKDLITKYLEKYRGKEGFIVQSVSGSNQVVNIPSPSYLAL